MICSRQYVTENIRDEKNDSNDIPTEPAAVSDCAVLRKPITLV